MSTQLTTKNDIRALISGEKMRQQFAAALPKHLSAERFCRVALTALTRTPKLAQCTPESLMRCLLDLSAYGIEPDGRRAHLIPFENRKQGTVECTLILDWKGLAELALRSGMIAKLHADVVCENDVFDFNLGEIVQHKIDFRKPRGEPYAVYALATTKDGATFVQVLNKEEVEKIRNNSQGYKAAIQYNKSHPWLSDPSEMWKKTAFRRLSKWLPLSAEFRDAVDKEDDAPPMERDVTPHPAALPQPLNPFEALPPIAAETQPEPKETTKAAPVAEVDGPFQDEEDALRFADLMDYLDGTTEAAKLADCLASCNDFKDAEVRKNAESKVTARAAGLGFKLKGKEFVK